MSKRRKRRRLAWMNRFNQVLKQNPGISISAAKQKTEDDVRTALRRADFLAKSRQEHQKIFEETLDKFNAPNEVEAKKVSEPVKVEPAKPKTTTKKPATAKKTTTTKKTTTRKKTTTTKTKKS